MSRAPAATPELALTKLCRACAEDRKAEDVAVLDVRGVCSYADYFIVCSATSDPHLRAVADALRERVREETGHRPLAIEGEPSSGWVVADFGDVVVHIFRPQTRAFYQIEQLWNDAPRVA